VVVDVFDRDTLIAAVRAAAPDVVMHQLTDLSAGDRVANAEVRRRGTRNLVDAAQAAGARRMVAQSIAWAYAGGEEPAREQAPLDLEADEPRGDTVRAVAALEDVVAEVPEAVVLRYGLFYGPGTWYVPGGAMAGEAVAGKLVADDAVSSFVHVEDAAAAALAALTWPPGAVNVCDDDPASGHEWLPQFCRSVGAPPPAPAPAAGRPGWARGADNHHARSDLGWEPRHPSWRTGFAASAVTPGG
jgi:nucleoside-diphosphate-sugar epimerase